MTSSNNPMPSPAAEIAPGMTGLAQNFIIMGNLAGLESLIPLLRGDKEAAGIRIAPAFRLD